MSPFLELAVPLVSKSLTFFFGTGFSKYLTDDHAPSWLELMIDLAARIDDKKESLSAKLFNTGPGGGKSTKYDLYVSAQILELEYKKRKADIRGAVVDVLNERINSDTINGHKVEELAAFFTEHQDVNLITTNYDTL